MKIINCKYCKKEIPEDSLLCPYCGKRFTKVQSFVDNQREKQRKMIEINKLKMELMKGSFKPIELKMFNIRQAEYSREKKEKGFKSKLIIYFLGFSIFITFIVVIMMLSGLIV